MKLFLLSLLLCAMVSQSMGAVLVRREAMPEAEPHRRHYRPSYYRPSYSYNSGYNTGYSHGYNNGGYNNYNNRPGVDLGALVPLKLAAAAGAVGGFKLAAALG